MPNIINVSNRLPVTVGEEIKKSSGGLVAALEGVSLDHGELKWIGWPGKALDEPAQRERLEHALVQEYGFTPVFLSDEQVEAFYEGFSNSTLWPLLHYMPSKFRYEPAWWDSYREVNAKFADQVATVAAKTMSFGCTIISSCFCRRCSRKRCRDCAWGFSCIRRFRRTKSFAVIPKAGSW